MNCYDMLCADIDTMIDGVIDCEGCPKTDCPKDQRKYGKDTNCIDCYHFKLCNFSKNFNKRSGVRCSYFKECSNIIEFPCKVKDLIDKVIGHNEIVAIWERRKGEEGRYHILLWQGMAWEIPDEYLNRTFLKIFGTVPDNISKADTVNLAVTPILKLAKETEKASKEREKNG